MSDALGLQETFSDALEDNLFFPDVAEFTRPGYLFHRIEPAVHFSFFSERRIVSSSERPEEDRLIGREIYACVRGSERHLAVYAIAVESDGGITLSIDGPPDSLKRIIAKEWAGVLEKA